jgi:malate synthase
MTWTNRVSFPIPEPSFQRVLTPEAVAFVAQLDSEFAARRVDILEQRRETKARLAAGHSLGFLPHTAAIREDPTWRVANPAADLLDRRVEITGPTDRKMAINALNSGARVWLADFEDATSPTWRNVVSGQLNLLDALAGRIEFTNPEGKRYEVHGDLPTIMVRPRGLHLPEKHFRIDGRPSAASIFDFGLYFFHCATRQLERGSGPYFYLPKLESHAEARLWNDIFLRAQELLAIPRGTIRATVLIETITAAFEMEEILFELREHSAGLNAGRWDYIFSAIKNFADRSDFVLPDRSDVTMTVPFMRAYTTLLVQTCHRRGAHAIGGMAAFVPNRADSTATAIALEKVWNDKEREACDGFDGSWVAHPDLVPICGEVFDARLGDAPNQLSRVADDTAVAADDLLSIAATPGTATLAGLHNNVSVSLRYLEAWLRGQGAIAINSLMEDAATVEISRSQVWQWLRHGIRLKDGLTVTRELVESVIEAEDVAIRSDIGAEEHMRRPFAQARELFAEVVFSDQCADFITLPGYGRLIRSSAQTAQRGVPAGAAVRDSR